MDIYCITHQKMDFIEQLNLIPVAVGETSCPKHYINEKKGINISDKNFNYGELTFHFWFWKNKLKTYVNTDQWFAMCHYRRFFINESIDMTIGNSISLNNLKSKLILKPLDDWKDCEVVICKPTNLQNIKKIKLIKRGFKSLIKDPSIFFNPKKHTIKLHFDMFHGHGNLDKAIKILPDNDRHDFEEYVNKKTSFSANIMYLSKNVELIDLFYSNLFNWLKDCEKIFGFENTNIYGLRRMYTFLAERYASFWFEKYSKVKYSSWIFRDFTK